jgi:type IV secretion system protein VirB8
MSSTPVANDYKAYMDMANPNTPFKIYGKNQSIRIKVSSIVLNDESKENKGATVRFQRFLFDKQTGGSRYLDNKIATLTFTYKDNLRMEEKYRYENPLGFQVLSYRVDSDLSTPSLENKVFTSQTPGLESVAQVPANAEAITTSTTNNGQTSPITTSVAPVPNSTSPTK